MPSILNYFKKLFNSQRDLSTKEKSTINDFSKVEMSDRQKTLIQLHKSKEAEIKGEICPYCHRPM
ncbi:MAG: hypothetical protein HQK91_14005 [Nitrospirae bacterium]|nr:hypothetical protein [Nitrospirota bacterium]